MKALCIRVSKAEEEHLKKYCKIHERTLNDVVRQFIRSLPIDGKTLESIMLSACESEPCTHQAENRLAG